MPCIGLLYFGVFLSLPCVLCALCGLLWAYMQGFILWACVLALLACVLVLCRCLLGIFYWMCAGILSIGFYIGFWLRCHFEIMLLTAAQRGTQGKRQSIPPEGDWHRPERGEGVVWVPENFKKKQKGQNIILFVLTIIFSCAILVP